MADTPRLTVCCEYPDMSSPPSEVSFRLSPSYGLLTAREAHDWFLAMMREHEQFEVETEELGCAGTLGALRRSQDEQGRPPKELPLTDS